MIAIFTIAKKEFIDTIRNKVFITFLLFLIVLTSISIYVGSVNFHDKVALFEKTYQVLIASGQSADNLVRPEFFPLQLLRATIEYLEIIGAILAISLGYLSIAKEKGNNTLPLIFSRPVSKIQFYFGKLLGGTGIIFMLSVLLFVIIIGVLRFVGGVSLSLVDVYKIILSAGATFLYLLTFFSFAMLCTILIKKSSNALIFSFVVWLLFVLVIPQIGDTMDTDNQLPGGFFNAIHVNQVDSHIILKQFALYENIRTGTESISITKHYERLTFALLGIKDTYNNKSLKFILSDRQLDLYLLVILFVLFSSLSTYIVNKNTILLQKNE